MNGISTASLAAALVAVFEGEKLTAYRDGGGVWTNGIGNTHNVVPGSTITHDQAIADFTRNQAPLLDLVGQYGMGAIAGAAYVSFGFDCGIGRLRDVLAGRDSIDNPAHTKDAHGNVEPGLVTRRRLEKLLTQLV